MNINRISTVIEAYQSNTNMPLNKARKDNRSRDEISISPEAKLYDTAKKAAAATPDIREEKVTALLKKLESGNYFIPAGDVAQKMLD